MNDYQLEKYFLFWLKINFFVLSITLLIVNVLFLVVWVGARFFPLK